MSKGLPAQLEQPDLPVPRTGLLRLSAQTTVSP